MAEERSALGHRGTEAEFHAELFARPEVWASTPEEVEAKYQRAVTRIEPLLDDYFPVRPRAPYGVRRLDPALEAGMTYGIYEPPTPQQPTGLYRYNGSNLQDRSLLNAAAIIYHELVPGHHFHVARQAENETLPNVRREAIEFGAFNEGWAEYAASLADEMGLYDEDYDRYGWLSHQRFIAQRLVVDTGMNVMGWPLEKGRAYMSRHTLESDLQVATETLRYSTALPAQALGYRLGFLTFHDLRDRAKTVLGPAFDIREFHEAVLGAGALPLAVLEQHLTARFGL